MVNLQLSVHFYLQLLVLCSYYARLAFVSRMLQNSKGSKIAAEHGVVKAKGSWVTLDTPAQKSEYFFPPTSPQHHPKVYVDVGLPAGKICMHSRPFFFLCEHFTSHSEFKLMYLNKQNKLNYGEHNFNLNFTRCRLNVDNSR